MSDQRLTITLAVDIAPIERELRRLSRSFRRWMKRRRGTDRRSARYVHCGLACRSHTAPRAWLADTLSLREAVRVEADRALRAASPQVIRRPRPDMTDERLLPEHLRRDQR